MESGLGRIVDWAEDVWYYLDTSVLVVDSTFYRGHSHQPQIQSAQWFLSISWVAEGRSDRYESRRKSSFQTWTALPQCPHPWPVPCSLLHIRMTRCDQLNVNLTSATTTINQLHLIIAQRNWKLTHCWPNNPTPSYPISSKPPQSKPWYFPPNQRPSSASRCQSHPDLECAGRRAQSQRRAGHGDGIRVLVSFRCRRVSIYMPISTSVAIDLLCSWSFMDIKHTLWWGLTFGDLRCPPCCEKTSN